MANKVDFPTFCHKPIILRGDHMGQIRTWQLVQNSAPIFICMDCTLLHNGGRSTVWCAYPKEERAVIFRDPLLFNLPCRGRSDSASAGRVPTEAQFTTDKGVDGRSCVFFRCSQNV